MKRIPVVLLIIYSILAAIYSIVTPIFEAPDESYHFEFIQHLAYTPELPVQDPKVKTPWFQEGGQPPLYYGLMAPIVRLTTSQYEPYPLATNPHAKIGYGAADINHNVYVHSVAETFPWQGVPLSVHLIRLLNIVFGACTVYAVYRTARLALPGKPGIAILAMALVALNPIFLFISGSINNDNPVTLLSVLAIWLMLLIVQRGFTMQRVALLSLVMALAVLSKVSGMLLYGTAGALLLLLLVKQRISFRQALIAGTLFIVAFAVVVGWWFFRNLRLYGDPTAMQSLLAFMETRHDPYTFGVMLSEMDGLRYSSWALFGWFNVLGPLWFITLMDVFTGLALVGGIVWGVRHIRLRNFEPFYPIGLLGLHFVIVFVAFIQWNRLIWATTGRLLYPAIASMSILIALGWYSLVEGRKSLRPLAAIPVVILLVVALLLPFTTIAPAYAPPSPVSALPADAIPADVTFEKIQVAGFRIDPAPVLPGGNLPITLYLSGEPDPRDLSLYLTVFDGAGQPVGKIDSYPGSGNLPTSAWIPGSLYADSYAIPISPAARGPAQFSVEFGWWDFATKTRIPATQADGKSLAALILRGGTLLAPAPATPPMVAQSAVFSGALRLNGYALAPADGALRAGETLQVTLNWEGLTRVYEDFTVFLHLETEDGKLVAQDDSPPLRGVYPTSAWAPGQPFAEMRQIQIAPGKVPPGTYRLALGLYRPDDLSRLPVDSGGDTLILRTKVQVKE